MEAGRGMRLVEGKGKAFAGEVFEQIIDKNTQHGESWLPPVRSTDKSGDLVLQSLRTVALAVGPKIGVGPRGFQSY